MIRVSAIVPLGPGEIEWHGLLKQLGVRLPPSSEVILVAAEENVPEPEIDWPERIPLRRLYSCAGRARQLNRGAAKAVGEWLWFLHADTRLDEDSIRALLDFLDRGEEALGWFDLAFRLGGPRPMPLNAWGANLRSSWLGLPFGDQGYVLSARAFASLGGFDETVARGEDHKLVWAAKRAGLPIRRVGAKLFTSARTYERSGWIATTARHMVLTAAQAWRERHRGR